MSGIGWTVVGFLTAWLLLCHINILILWRWVADLRAPTTSSAAQHGTTGTPTTPRTDTTTQGDTPVAEEKR